MQENDKRLVIISDDDIGTYNDVSQIFQNCGVEVEVIRTHSTSEALQKIRELTEAGRRIDLISFDAFEPCATHLESNAREIQQVMDYFNGQPQSLRPGQVFIHSKDISFARERILGYVDFGDINVDVVDSMEYLFIGKWGARDTDGLGHLNPDVSRKIRKYVNRAWGTNFPTFRREIELLNRPPKAKIEMHEATEAVEQGILTSVEALMRLYLKKQIPVTNSLNVGTKDDGDRYDEFVFDTASPGAAVGRIAFSEDDITSLRTEHPQDGIILVLDSFLPHQAHLLTQVDGIVLLGEGTEHLKILTDNHDIPAIMGGVSRGGSGAIEEGSLVLRGYCPADQEEGEIKARLNSGDFISFDSSYWLGEDYYNQDLGKWMTVASIDGTLYADRLPIIKPSDVHQGSYVTQAVFWADRVIETMPNTIQVHANVDSADHVVRAIEQGVSGVGLLRTEHTILLNPQALNALQEVMKAPSYEARQIPLQRFGEAHQADMRSIFEAADQSRKNFPLTIRLLDAPLDEFLLPDDIDSVRTRVGGGNERGVQFALQTEGLYQAQIKAILQAAMEAGYQRPLKLMVPNVRNEEELAAVRAMIDGIAKDAGFRGQVLFGSMIETLEAVENASGIGHYCDFISFGTNDLTSEVMGGIRRNDVVAVQAWMQKNGHVGKTPFAVLADPVKEKMRQAITAIKEDKPEIEISACGEQFSDSSGVQAAQELGLGAISMSARTTDYARITIAQAELEKIGADKMLSGVQKRLDKGFDDPAWLEHNDHIFAQALDEAFEHPWLIGSTVLAKLRRMCLATPLSSRVQSIITDQLAKNREAQAILSDEYAAAWVQVTTHSSFLKTGDRCAELLLELLYLPETIPNLTLSPIGYQSGEGFLGIFKAVLECCREDEQFGIVPDIGRTQADLVQGLYDILGNIDAVDGSDLLVQANAEVTGHFNPMVKNQFDQDRDEMVPGFIRTLEAAGLATPCR